MATVEFAVTGQARTGTEQIWTVPSSGYYRITANGARAVTNIGGLGASMSGVFSLTAGEEIYIVVGQMGGIEVSSGGGGGTFVWKNPTTPELLIAAGGGGGVYNELYEVTPNQHATTATTGQPGEAGPGGVDGDGGKSTGTGANGWAGGGAGWLADGQVSQNSISGNTANGFTRINGFLGGTTNTSAFGGYGGGGGTHGNSGGGGGGGGYSGGGAGNQSGILYNGSGGGGGSYNAGIDQQNFGGETAQGITGAGSVTITATSYEESSVSGVIQLAGTPVQRTVQAFTYSPVSYTIDQSAVNQVKSLGQATSDPVTGAYTITLNEAYKDDIFVIAFDNYGTEFVADMVVNVNDRVHPTTPDGYVQECTVAGTLPSTEPVWSTDTTTAQTYGTASMIAKTFYRPLVHGPVIPEVVNELGTI